MSANSRPPRQMGGANELEPASRRSGQVSEPLHNGLFFEGVLSLKFDLAILHLNEQVLERVLVEQGKKVKNVLLCLSELADFGLRLVLRSGVATVLLRSRLRFFCLALVFNKVGIGVLLFCQIFLLDLDRRVRFGRLAIVRVGHLAFAKEHSGVLFLGRSARFQLVLPNGALMSTLAVVHHLVAQLANTGITDEAVGAEIVEFVGVALNSLVEAHHQIDSRLFVHARLQELIPVEVGVGLNQLSHFVSETRSGKFGLGRLFLSAALFVGHEGD